MTLCGITFVISVIALAVFIHWGVGKLCDWLLGKPYRR